MKIKMLLPFLFLAACSSLGPVPQIPFERAQKSSFATSSHLPGESFRPNFSLPVAYDEKGNLLLIPGDYVIPVMTYCMDSQGISEDGHVHTLTQMEGSRAKMIRDLNLRGPTRYSFEDIQILSWSLQNGLKYDELTVKSQQMINETLAEYKPALQRSALENLQEQWDEISSVASQVLPESLQGQFETVSQLREAMEKMRSFRDTIRRVGHDYQELSRDIQIKRPTTLKTNTPWSQISDRVYARFLTDGHYQELSQIQIRVLEKLEQRHPNAAETVVVDLLSLIADPNNTSMQPLSFSPIYGYGGVAVIPALARTPVLAVAVLGAVLAAETIDWNAFQKLSELLKNVKNADVQKKISEGKFVLNEIHDRLEKPLRDKGIINKKSKRTAKSDDKPTRQYENSGGQDALDKAFDKLDGKPFKSDGLDGKEFPNGDKAIKRPASGTQHPTIEIQPQKTGHRGDDSIRVKVRYP